MVIFSVLYSPPSSSMLPSLFISYTSFSFSLQTCACNKCTALGVVKMFELSPFSNINEGVE